MVEYKQSAQLSKQAEQYIPGGVNTSLRRISPPLSFTRAHGSVITDADGHDFLDYQAAFGPIILGHNFPEVNQRVQEVMERIDLVGVGQTDVEIELARKICEHIPSAEKVLFCNSGSEATYGAVRLARAVTGRKKLIKFQGCYHGWHDYLAMNVITPAEKLGMRDPLSAGSLDEALRATLICEFNNLEDVSRTLQQNRGEIAAIIVEPIPHNIGCVLPQPGFLEGLREMTRENGVILIFDEVVTGFRHSLGGYQKLCGVTPDLTTLGKAMANGYPIAAICGKNELMDQFNTRQGGSVFFAGTYNGHPFACAAALATIEVMEKQRVHDHVFRLGEKMRKGLKEILQLLKIKATVAGFGSIFLIYFLEGPVNNYADLLQNDQELFVSHRRKLMDRGIFQLPLNLKRNHISFSHTDEDIERTLQATGEVLATTPSVRG
ncbi:MAG TPA: aspartate aminotransferase family protein [Terriglobia bacterium]|nr:aspartate aminotransferase family protein [Terriglobia bacterium]